MAQDTDTLAEQQRLDEQLATIQMLLDLAVQRVENLAGPPGPLGRFWERDLHVLIEEIEEARRLGSGEPDCEVQRVAIRSVIEGAGRGLSMAADQLATVDSLADDARLAAAFTYADQQLQRARERLGEIEARS